MVLLDSASWLSNGHISTDYLLILIDTQLLGVPHMDRMLSIMACFHLILSLLLCFNWALLLLLQNNGTFSLLSFMEFKESLKFHITHGDLLTTTTTNGITLPMMTTASIHTQDMSLSLLHWFYLFLDALLRSSCGFLEHLTSSNFKNTQKRIIEMISFEAKLSPF